MLEKKTKQWRIDRAFKICPENEKRIKDMLFCLRPVKHGEKTQEQAIRDLVECGVLPIRNGVNNRGKEGYEQSTATLPRTYGLIGKDAYETLEVSDLYLDGRLSFKDLITLQLLKKEFIYNDDGTGEVLHPVQVLLKTLLAMYDINPNEAWFDEYDYFYYLTEIKKTEDIKDCARLMINSHRTNNRISEYAQHDFDMWIGALLVTELIVPSTIGNESRYFLNKDEIEFVRWIASIKLENIGTYKSRRNEEEQRRFGMVNSSIVSKIPKINININDEWKLEGIDCESKILKLFLFDGLSYRNIEKNVFGKQYDGNGDAAMNILKSYGMDKPIKYQGVFKPFKNELDLVKLSMEYAKGTRLYHFLFEVDEQQKDEELNDKTYIEELDVPSPGYNKIFYGIPGCGKSYHVENFELKGVDKEKDVIRTTFYLDYANSDFIGQLYPHVDEKGDVTYTHIPGPFTEALERAFNNKGKMIYLVIEEINRGNAAAIFGDVFQLLDRLKEDRDGRRVGDSEYPISNAFIEDYFKKEKVDYTPGQIYIPRNLTIFATMNTSDQNVFPLDTAFKRRWDREMVTADWDKVSFRNKYVPCTNITWEKFATVINKEILKQNDDSDVTISEDKQIGAFFVRESMLSDVEKDGTRDQLIPFVTNVIDYLYNDVTKFDHKILFNKDITSYDNLYEKMEVYINNYDKNTNESGCGPLEILFNDDLVDILKNSSEDE